MNQMHSRHVDSENFKENGKAVSILVKILTY